MSDARAEVLRRVHEALSDVPCDETPDQVEIPRAYDRDGRRSPQQSVELLAERLGEYRATVHRAPAGRAREQIETCCAQRAVQRMIVPGDLPDSWRPREVTTVVDDGLSHQDLDGCDAVLTACAVAVAMTGTIILDGGPGQGRRAISLVPDYHLCVVAAEQVVESVPEGLARVALPSGQSPRPMTLISGPSATSDIELRRVEGVHGPRILEVLILE